MKTSIATVSISGTLQEKLTAIAEAGFDGVEIFEQDFIADDRTPKEIGREVRDHGLEIFLFQPFRDFEGLPEPDRTRAFDRAERKFDVMQELDVDLMLICSSVHPRSLGGVDRAADDLRELGARAARRGLRIGWEALAWGKHINDHRDAWEIIRRADHLSVGLILDSFHTLARKLSPESIRAIPGDRIFFVQLADAPLIDMDLLYWSRHFRNMPGEGDLDILAFLRAVASTGYAGPLSLEIFNDQFRGGSPKAIALDGRRPLRALIDDVNLAEPESRLDAAPMPPRTSVEGVEFVEFAADEDEADRLGDQLTSMGFRHAGQHINKAVSLWRQGAINVVINTEREGFAHASYLANGTSVCDIGLKVNDAAATVERAHALGVSLFHQPVGQGELDLPAVYSVGGGVMHFIDDATGLSNVWDIEFRPVDGATSGDAGLICIDHAAQSMSYDEMLTWSLFYTTLFQVQRKPMDDVIDPGGVVSSQAIETDDGRLRLTLNGTDTDRTLAGRFVAGRFGSAVQHLAFATKDIVATAESLVRRGFAPLPIPENYYADMRARFGLPQEQVDALQHWNLLYDEDNDGQFQQLYSRPYGDGFFVEIVQRTGGYGGYGAANAPFRIAALKRLLSAREPA